MRTLACAVFFWVALVPDRPSPDANKRSDLDMLQGTWQVTAFDTPDSKRTAEQLRNYPKLIIKGNEYTWSGSSGGTFKIDAVKNPKTIDYVDGKNANAPVRHAIFEFIDADTFRDCIGAAGAPRHIVRDAAGLRAATIGLQARAVITGLRARISTQFSGLIGRTCVMRWQRLVFFVAACWAGGPILGFAPFVGAQPLEVQEFGAGTLTVRDAVRALVVLNTPVDVRPFGKDISVKAALVEIYEQLAAKKLKTTWLVDRHAMSVGRPDFDFHDARVNLSKLPRYAPAGMVLQEMFDQTKTGGIFVVRPGFYEVTTRKAFLTRPRLGFFCWTMVGFAFTNTGDAEPDVLPASLDASSFPLALEKLNVYSNNSVTERGKAELQKKLPKLRFYEPPLEKAA